MSFPQFLHHSALAMTVSIAASMLSIANARVYEYKFTDIHGAQKSVSESAPYLNPHGSFNVLLIGGLDQQIRISVFRDTDTNAVFSTTTASLLLMIELPPQAAIIFTGRQSLFLLSVMDVTP